jgi:hypothetical protein
MHLHLTTSASYQTGCACCAVSCGVQVMVHYPQGRQQLVTYRQAFTGPTSRHCCNCFRLVEGCSLPQDAVLQGGLDLFCSLDCERLFFIKNSSSEWQTAPVSGCSLAA